MRTGKQATKCPPNFYVDILTGKCKPSTVEVVPSSIPTFLPNQSVCPPGYSRNIVNNQCVKVACPPGYSRNIVNNQCVKNPTIPSPSTVCTCPPPKSCPVCTCPSVSGLGATLNRNVYSSYASELRKKLGEATGSKLVGMQNAASLIDAQSYQMPEQASGVAGIPWMYVLGGVAILGAATWYVMSE